jgi:predicted MPP superfamily phosphohydrolase
MFFAVVLSVWTALNVYVGWRLAGLPWLAAHLGARWTALGVVLLWLSYPVARLLSARGLHAVAQPLEFIGAPWIGILFLLFASLLLVDVVTLGGWLFPRSAPQLRTGAVLAGLLLSGIALIQGLRAPVVREHEVVLPSLPRAHDGLTLIVVSDLHLGTLIGKDWLAARLAQIDALRPDAVLIAGDLVDSDLDGALALQPILRRLQAPRGVFCVLGNHDVYAGTRRVVEFAEGAGVKVLRNQTVELAPGLQLTGIDDPATLRGTTAADRRLRDALAGTSGAATILLAHTPDSHTAAEAAAAGVVLMFSGHTHGGQLWPFGEIVRRRFPLFVGRYDVGAMTVLVGRGTGTWGPRLRLWSPGEILRVRLRAAA